MSTQVTVTLPDDTYRRAEYLARLTGRDIADVLAETLHLSLQPLGVQHAADRPVAELSAADVLAAADSEMDSAQERRFRELLEARHALQAARLTHKDRATLLALMQVYQEGLLRKAQALHEAAQRGLRPPLAP